MKRLLLMILLILAAGLLAACGGDDDEPEATLAPTQSPQAMLSAAADYLQLASSFRFDIVHSGPDYVFSLDQLGIDADITFRRAEAHFAAPDELYAVVHVLGGPVAIELDIYIKDADQWLRLRSLGLDWGQEVVAEDFNPAALIADDDGFEEAIASLRDVAYIGEESLDDGAEVEHLRGVTDGEVITNLLVGIIEMSGEVPVDVYIDRDTGLPVRLVIEQTDTVTEDQPEPMIWTIDIFAIGDAPDFTPPPAAG